MSQISDEDWGPTWCWGWSPGQAESLLHQAFPGGDISVERIGNRFAGVAFLHGLVTDELDQARLLDKEGACNFLVGAVARRAAS